MSGQLYEVIRWGNDETEEGPNGEDTCFLVRAESPEQAAKLVDALLLEMPHNRVEEWAHAIYLVGTDVGDQTDHRILRGPYFQYAYCHGWRRWQRIDRDDDWKELLEVP